MNSVFNFCTLFDSNYLARGLVLYHSLNSVCDNFHLFIFAFNQKAYQFLMQENLQHATIISLNEFEDDALLAVKPTRSPAEYCWTSTSSTVLYVLNKFKVPSCTYVDADMRFYASPEPLFQELGDKSILLTEHRYSPQYNKELKSGKYCVQYMTFKNNEQGRTALMWWRERCLEWCYARFEDGKFGDQLYLDDWTERFPGVHVLQHLGAGLASWNVQQYTFAEKNKVLIGTDISGGKIFPVIFYHFHYVRLFSGNIVELGRRILSKNTLETFYYPYLRELIKTANDAEQKMPGINPNGITRRGFSWKNPLLYLYRKLYGIYHIYRLEKVLPPHGTYH